MTTDDELAPDNKRRTRAGIQFARWAINRPRGIADSPPSRPNWRTPKTPTGNPKVAKSAAPPLGSGLRLPSASRTSGSGIPDLEPLVRVRTEEWSGNPIDAMAPWEDHRESKRRTVDAFPPVTPEQFASRGSAWRRWRGWLR